MFLLFSKHFYFFPFLDMYTLLYLLVCFLLCWVFFAAGFLWLRSSGAALLLPCTGFSLRWLLLFGSRALGMRASVVVVHRFSCSSAYGMFPDQGLNPCPLHWWVLICTTWEARRLINVVFHCSHNKIRVLCFRRGKQM